MSNIDLQFNIKTKNQKSLESALRKARAEIKAINSESGKPNTGIKKSLDDAKKSVKNLSEEVKKSGTTAKKSFDGAKKSVNSFNKQVKKSGTGAKSGFNGATKSVKGFSSELSSAKKLLVGFFTVGATGALFKGLLNVNREMETLRAQLKSLTGSQQGAQKAFSFVQDFAKDTPFQIKGLTRAFVNLQNFGIKPTAEVMSAITNQASEMV